MKRVVQYFISFVFLLFLYEICTWITELIHLPIPGNVIGMLLLFILLQTKIVKLEWVEATSGFLVKHLAFFFVPIAIGLMTMGPMFKRYALSLAVVLIVSLIIGFVIAAYTVQRLSQKEEEAEHHDSAHYHL
ncbi:CidA/LrgA family protein [Bacillus massiliglaciei]|uniref:CidA/LrgA family protein n=1 Tax=Bacillus massiliglaciei TaxID=1816693 RepID=UPI000A77556D|nr:CidA/LrgA family protein [Bacillus massiliglaciei]